MLIYVVVIVTALVMILVEHFRPGRQWPKVEGWWARAAALNGGQAVLLYVTGLVWDGFIASHRLWDAAGLGVIGGGLVGYVVHSFVYYWWHRARHEVPVLWRLVHQVHHSPQRIEIITAFYKHPLEILLNSLLSSVVVYLVVGLTPQQALATMILNGLAELLYHWNVRTPVWLGYLIQRPESHCVHHQEGLHKYNYGDLPVFDWMFGTLRNPPSFDGRCGMGADKEAQLGRMLRGEDVSA
jgi:sterol desaturase/sphingolipid hydroxylase (fatty acid hydroxylase superfamily)